MQLKIAFSVTQPLDDRLAQPIFELVLFGTHRKRRLSAGSFFFGVDRHE